MGPSGLWDHHEFCVIWRGWNSPGAEWIMQPPRCATVLFLFLPLTSRREDEGQILIPALTQWSFHSPASLLKQLISPGLLSFCQLLISRLPHLSWLQPLNLRLRHTSAIRPGECGRAGRVLRRGSLHREKMFWSVMAASRGSVLQQLSLVKPPVDRNKMAFGFGQSLPKPLKESMSRSTNHVHARTHTYTCTPTGPCDSRVHHMLRAESSRAGHTYGLISDFKIDKR